MSEAMNSSVFGLIAELAERITELPAVATLDWCDRAAECLANLPGARATGVLIATLGDGGRLVDLEAAGFASVSGDPGTRERLLWLRSRAETLRNVGWAVACPSAGCSQSFRAELPGDSGRWGR